MGWFLKWYASTTGVALLVGLGARRLSQQGPPNAFVATSWTEEDEQLLGIHRGVPAHQATWEAFHGIVGSPSLCHCRDSEKDCVSWWELVWLDQNGCKIQ